MQTFTFICFGSDGASGLVDLQALAEAQIEIHARRLLADHASAGSVEIWRGDQWLGRMDRHQDALSLTPPAP